MEELNGSTAFPCIELQLTADDGDPPAELTGSVTIEVLPTPGRHNPAMPADLQVGVSDLLPVIAWKTPLTQFLTILQANLLVDAARAASAQAGKRKLAAAAIVRRPGAQYNRLLAAE